MRFREWRSPISFLRFVTVTGLGTVGLRKGQLVGQFTPDRRAIGQEVVTRPVSSQGMPPATLLVEGRGFFLFSAVLGKEG